MSTTDRDARGTAPLSGAGDGVTVRAMRPRDVERVVAIERASFAVPWTASTFRGLLERRSTGLWVAESGDEIVGYAVVWAVLDQAELGNVAVADGWRRRGIATRLVDTVLAWLRERAVQHLYLEVRESNTGAQRLYERHGFQEVGRRAGYYSRPPEDALVLHRVV